MIYVTAGALSIAVMWFGIAGLWYLALTSYVFGGIVWVAYEVRRPPFYRSMAYTSPGGTVFMLVIWPLRATSDFLEMMRLRRSDERYVVVGDGDHRKYGNWDDAVRDAREQAKSKGERVMVLDRATFAKQLGRVKHKSWFVEPNGNVEHLPRSLF